MGERVFISSTGYDALNRPVAVTAPDGSVTRLQFNRTGLLQRVDVQLRDDRSLRSFVTQIDYNAKARRTNVVYGNGLRTRYAYDPLTFRLTTCQTLRGDERLQDLTYLYDPAGNITHIQDDAQQPVYFSNQVVTPSADYTYDALYRLVSGQGREHI